MLKIPRVENPLTRSWGWVIFGVVRRFAEQSVERPMVSIYSRKLGAGPAQPAQVDSINAPQSQRGRVEPGSGALRFRERRAGKRRAHMPSLA
jgi:hypothetical protein